MTRTLLAALLAATALSAGAAWAQPGHEHDHGGGGHPGGHAGGRGPAPRGGGHPGGGHAGPAHVRSAAQAHVAAAPAARGGGGGGFSYRGRPHERIRGPAFSYPSGYGYRRWGIGAILPSIFLGGAYWFDSYANYGFGPPPFGYRWVRYGPDLLLVSVRTGRIRQVVYGVFY